MLKSRNKLPEEIVIMMKAFLLFYSFLTLVLCADFKVDGDLREKEGYSLLWENVSIGGGGVLRLTVHQYDILNVYIGFSSKYCFLYFTYREPDSTSKGICGLCNIYFDLDMDGLTGYSPYTNGRGKVYEKDIHGVDFKPIGAEFVLQLGYAKVSVSEGFNGIAAQYNISKYNDEFFNFFKDEVRTDFIKNKGKGIELKIPLDLFGGSKEIRLSILESNYPTPRVTIPTKVVDVP